VLVGAADVFGELVEVQRRDERAAGELVVGVALEDVDLELLLAPEPDSRTLRPR
jgi:hypothetical protein